MRRALESGSVRAAVTIFLLTLPQPATRTNTQPNTTTWCGMTIMFARPVRSPICLPRLLVPSRSWRAQCRGPPVSPAGPVVSSLWPPCLCLVPSGLVMASRYCGTMYVDTCTYGFPCFGHLGTMGFVSPCCIDATKPAHLPTTVDGWIACRSRAFGGRLDGFYRVAATSSREGEGEGRERTAQESGR